MDGWGGFQQCKTKVKKEKKKQNRKVMDFREKNNGEILIISGLGCL